MLVTEWALIRTFGVLEIGTLWYGVPDQQDYKRDVVSVVCRSVKSILRV